MSKVALVGLGRWGRRLLDEFNEQSEVVICCNRSDLSGQVWVGENYAQIRCTFDYSDVINSPEVDAVVIATPISTHAELTKQALTAGKHVFVEKPLAASSIDAGEMVALARSEKKVLFPGHIFLYHQVFDRLMEELKNDPAVSLSFLWTKMGTFGEDLIWNLGIHDISLALKIFDSYAVEGSDLQLFEVQDGRADVANVSLGFSGGRKCVININRLSTTNRKELTVRTRSGRVLIWQDNSLLEWNDGATSPLMEAELHAMKFEVAEFLRQIESEECINVEVDHVLAAVQVTESLLSQRNSNLTNLNRHGN